MKPYFRVSSLFGALSLVGFCNVLLADAEDSKYLKDLQAEKAALETQLASTPNDDETNLLYAATLLLDLAEAAEFKDLLISAGVSSSISTTTLNDLETEHDFELNTSFNASAWDSYFEDTLIPQVELVGSHLAKVSDTAVITLTTTQTGSDEDVLVDYADVLVVRAMLKAFTAFLQIDHAYGANIKVSDIQDLNASDLISAESILDLDTSLGSATSPSSLTSSKTNLQEAIALYQEASPLLRDTPRMTQNRLFNLEGQDDLDDEAIFLADLEETLTALDGEHNFDDENNATWTVDLSKFFAGKLDLSTMLPDSVGDRFVNANVSDPTFGGIFPNWTQEMITEDVTEEDMIANNLWNGANSLGSGWWQSHWWGMFFVSGSDWIYHYPLGWMYQATETPSSVWFWNSEMGWLWTTSRIFPFVYEYGDGSKKTWLYYIVGSNNFLEQSGSSWVLR